jgi:hypothetical protein
MALLNLDELKNLQELRHLDNLDELKELSKLQNLHLLNNMHYLQKLQHLDQLQQLHMLNRMAALDKLNQLQKLNELLQLSKLHYMENLHELDNLHRLQQLDVLNRLRIVDRLLNFNFTTLLYLLSIFVPGLVFQETISLLLHEKLGVKRSLVLMVIYNVLSLLMCLLFGFHWITSLLPEHKPYQYVAWFGILVLFPCFFGWLVSVLANTPRFRNVAQRMTSSRQKVVNAWEHFLSGAESYRVVITLNNEEKLMGIFQSGRPAPETVEPNDLYFTETSHYDPHDTEWKELVQPVDVWVKGSEIKMLEVAPQA